MPVEKIQEAAVGPSKVVACHRLEMAGHTPALEARSRLASCIPCIAISLRPESQRQRASLALRWPELSDALSRRCPSCARQSARI